MSTTILLRLRIGPEHSVGEARWITFGASDFVRPLVVAHTEDGESASTQRIKRGEVGLHAQLLIGRMRLGSEVRSCGGRRVFG